MNKNITNLEQTLTGAVADELIKQYNGLEVYSNRAKLDFSNVSKKDIININLDLKFYFKNPELPLENLCSRIDNFETRTESHKDLLKYAKHLLSLDKTATAGLFIYGNPGVGKSHMAVALAKRMMLMNQEAYFLSGENYRLSAKLGPNQVWILDDLNSPYGMYMSAFKEIVLNAHNKGGRVFVTSNTPYQKLMDHAFVADPEDELRYMDRTKNMFEILKIGGNSKREEKSWINQGRKNIPV